jgi:hypothetical protein
VKVETGEFTPYSVFTIVGCAQHHDDVLGDCREMVPVFVGFLLLLRKLNAKGVRCGGSDNSKNSSKFNSVVVIMTII